MILSLHEFMTWIDTSIFEMWTTVLSIFITTFLLVLKLHEILNISFTIVFSPIFVALAFNLYFHFIILMRTCVEFKDYKSPIMKFFLNGIRISLCATFIVLLTAKCSGEFDNKEVAVPMSYGLVFLPFWVLMATLSIQVCRSTDN